MILHNAGGAANGPIDMSDALKVSSDVYFYSLGLEASAEGARPDPGLGAEATGSGRSPGSTCPARAPA